MAERIEWPRVYAARIIDAPTRQERKRLLEDVPAHLQEIVKKHVVNHFELRKQRRKTNGR